MGGGHPVHVGRSKQGNNGPLQSYSGFGSGVVVGQDASLTKLYVRLTAGDQIFVVRLVFAVCQPWSRMNLRRLWFLGGPIFAVSVCDSMMTERFSVYSEPVALSVVVHNARTCELRLATPLLSRRLGLASWCKSDWQDDDLFKLSVPELEVLKLRVAVCLKCRYKGHVNGDFGLEVGGMKPLDPEASEPQRRDRSGKVKEVHSIPG